MIRSTIDSNKDTNQKQLEGNESFCHIIEIGLKDSNAYGNTYFARYFEWQGMCREQWFYRCIASDMLQKQGIFITKFAHQEYEHETFPFQTVRCYLNTSNIKRCSFCLNFKFYVDEQLISTGQQCIVFADLNKKISKIPIEIIQKIKKFEVN